MIWSYLAWNTSQFVESTGNGRLGIGDNDIGELSSLVLGIAVRKRFDRLRSAWTPRILPKKKALANARASVTWSLYFQF